MAVNIITSVYRGVGKGKCNIFCFKGKPTTLNLPYISCASISSVSNRDPNYKRLPPFPYKEKKYRMVRSWFDRTSKRLDENSKIIVVDGPIAVGKTALATKLAEEFDMHLMPEANLDMVFINEYGFDQRSLNDVLPPGVRRTDEKDFCLDPFNINSAAFQFHLFELRLSMYIDALAHVLNTGQGVVMVRSVYSDMVFLEAMANQGYIRKEALKCYYEMRREVFPELMRPHLQIYLDIPVPVVLERIKKRAVDWEVNSKALTPNYLEAIEDAYKRKHLPEIEKHADLLIYDWTEAGDMELIIEDVERIDFDKYTVYDSKSEDWRFGMEQHLADKRMMFTNRKHTILAYGDIPMYDCPELYADPQDVIALNDIFNEVPSMKYTKGYNKEAGDSGIFFKTTSRKQDYPYTFYC